MFIYQIIEKIEILKPKQTHFCFYWISKRDVFFFLTREIWHVKIHSFLIICNFVFILFWFFFSDKLTYIFQKLGFLVRRYDNLEDVAMYRRLVDVSLEDHSNYDCFVCCILSHGVLQNIYGTNGRLVRISELTGIFRSRKCTGLAGKPKLFFIQACQGREKQMGNFTRHFLEHWFL